MAEPVGSTIAAASHFKAWLVRPAQQGTIPWGQHARGLYLLSLVRAVSRLAATCVGLVTYLECFCIIFYGGDVCMFLVGDFELRTFYFPSCFRTTCCESVIPEHVAW